MEGKWIIMKYQQCMAMEVNQQLLLIRVNVFIVKYTDFWRDPKITRNYLATSTFLYAQSTNLKTQLLVRMKVETWDENHVRNSPSDKRLFGPIFHLTGSQWIPVPVRVWQTVDGKQFPNALSLITKAMPCLLIKFYGES